MLGGARGFRLGLAALLAAAVGALAAVSGSAPAATDPAGTPSTDLSDGALHAVIRRTEHGIPHILADDYAGAGYGYGYAFAQDNICTMANGYVTVRAERSRYFGPNESYASRGNGAVFNNLDSDFFFQRAIDKHTVEALVDEAPPRGPLPEVREAVRGYVAGYNRYLADTGVDNLPDPTCRGAAWVKPITELDAYRRFYQLGILASQGVAIDGIAQAQPPGPVVRSGSAARAGRHRRARTPSRNVLLRRLAAKLSRHTNGSNAVALGSLATDNGRGMMLGNPHFPWDGTERFYQAHITIPDKLNVSGASLFGVPVVLIGHTDNMAWSHTVSTAFRFTPFELKLVPGSPTTYLYDNQPHEMTADTVTVQAKQSDGTLAPQTRTLYSSLQGPIFNSILGLPLFPWTPERAYAMGDVNGANFRYLNHFFETDRAQSVAQLDGIERKYQGIPWVNTIAADSSGKAYYADIGAIPNVSDAKAQTCVNGVLGVAAGKLIGLPILDGSTSSCAWDTDPDSAVPGIFGPSHEPSLFRDDYVTNSNDSYWLANPAQPLEGFARIIGDERTARSLRTRLGLKMVQERLAGTDGQAGNRFSLQNLQDMVFNDRQHAGELWRDDLVAMCNANPVLVGSNGPVDVSAACPVLASWDLHDNLNSNGAVLFRRFASRALAANTSPYKNAFDVADPVNTPNGLDTNNPEVREALADAVSDLSDSGIPLDAPLLGYQYEQRGEEKIPIHGGPGDPNGTFNAINVPWVPGEGFPDVPHGSSFVMTTQFTDGCPENRSILTYSQSTDPTSPWFADQTRMFSNKEWVDPPFCEDQVLHDKALEVTTLGPKGVIGSVCMAPARVLVGKGGIGLVRLGDTLTRMTRRAGKPSESGKRVVRYCVVGGGRLTAVFGGKPSRARLIATSARSARYRRAKVDAKLAAVRRGRGGVSRVGKALYRVGGRGSRVLIGMGSSGRVSFLAVVDRRVSRSRKVLVRYLRALGPRV